MKSEERASLYRYRFGTAEFDEARFELTVGDLAVEIQRKPLEMLAVLLRHANEVVTRDELLETVWGGRPTVEHVVANALAKLRVALGDENAARIVTQTKVGYRLIGPVERIAVGRHFASALQLRIGLAVPRRENFLLQCAIGQTLGSEVWLAQHAKTGERRVFKFSSDGARLAALKREATLSRVLRSGLGDRQDLVRVIDWNFHEPPFFLECEYAGPDLAAWSETDGHLRTLSSEERLTLFLQIADAVAAAHSVGVLHKDLKPTNILVCAKPDGWQLRVSDFGSGRLLEMDRLVSLGITQLGLTLTQGVGTDSSSGTLLYLAPELFTGEGPTVQSDVYALGLMLYQLLIGDLRRPLVSGWERDIVDPDVREDIARATDGDPARRLKSAAELADRLRALEARRVERETRQEQQRQFEANRDAVRRARVRKPWVAATIISLAIGLAISLSLYIKVRSAREAQARDFAAARTLNAFLTQDFIALADPSYAGRRDVTVIEAARGASGRIDARFSDVAPEIRAGLHASMQQSLHGLGDYDAAIDEGRKALQAFASAGVENARAVDVRLALAYDYIELSRLQESAEQLQAAAASIKREHLENSAVAARYRYVQASVDADRLDLPNALEGYRHAWELAEMSAEVPPELRDSIEFALADIMNLSGQSAEAEKHIKNLLARQTQRLGPTHPKTCHSAAAESRIFIYQRRFNEALPIATAAEACLAKALGPTHARTLSAQEIIADLYYLSEDYSKAAVAYQQIAQAYTQQLGPVASRTVNIRVNVGVSLLYSGQMSAAEQQLTAALEESSAALNWTHPMMEHLRFHLADCRLDLHQTKGVAHLLDGLSAEVLNEGEIETDWDGRLAYEAGRLALDSGDPVLALAKLETAASVFAAKHSEGHFTEAQVRALMEQARPNRRHSSI